MKKTDGKFTAICHEVAKDYPEMEVEDWYIDIMTANLVNPAIRSRFEVFILPDVYKRQARRGAGAFGRPAGSTFPK